MRYLPTRNSFFFAITALFFGAMMFANSACKKTSQLTNGGELRFSHDTLTFDTVFTALSSATLGVKIYNPNDQKVVLSTVRVEKGSSSFFQLNVDGRSGRAVNDVEIAANDSVYVFATVKIDPTSALTPFIVEDKLTATLNGKDYSVPLIAFGQNAYYITDSVLAVTDTWKNDKPYVVFGYAEVAKDKTLTIPAGCRIYMHANARLFVDGTLKANGTKQDSIIFQGDRLDRSYFGYEGYPGEWGGIYFTSRSTENELTYVVLKNGGNGAQRATPALIQVSPDSVIDAKPQLTLNNVILENSIGYGLLSFGGNVVATNCLLHSCGASALALVLGGNYTLNHCTIVTYGNSKIAHTENPAAVILNWFKNGQLPPDIGPLDCSMTNCVVSGSLSNEFVADSIEFPVSPAKLKLTNCVLRTESDKIRPWVKQGETNVKYISAGPSLDSLFKSVSKADYHPSSTSILIDMALPGIAALDLDGTPRTNTPDIGCYEAR